MSLAATFSVRRGSALTSVALDAQAGEVIGLIGPNGAGKTTALRALAGLLPIDTGSITLSGSVLADTRSHRPAYSRPVGFVFQDSLLFPHLSALDNVAFGLRSRGARRADARRVAASWLDRLEIADLAARRPNQLSGGQAQRVAIARALAPEPELVLLDEPTASLDAASAMALRSALRGHLTSVRAVSVVVTHTALDALILADSLVVLEAGVVVQSGRPAEVAAQPRSQHVAALVGLNLLRGVAGPDGSLELPSGTALVVARRLPGPAFAAFAPAAVSVFRERPDGSPRNVWPGKVTAITPHGDAVRLQVSGPAPLLADITPAALGRLSLRVGSPVWTSVKATEIAVYPA